MRKTIIGVLVCASSVFAVSPKDRKEVDNRLTEASAVFAEIMNAPDRGIPQDLLEKAHCAVIIPGVKKGAFIVGAQFGKGFISCRGKSDRGWSAPAAIRLEGGSFGFQIGGSETDVVMLVMNDRGADRLLSSQFTLGGEGEVAAGPVGQHDGADGCQVHGGDSVVGAGARRVCRDRFEGRNAAAGCRRQRGHVSQASGDAGHRADPYCSDGGWAEADSGAEPAFAAREVVVTGDTAASVSHAC